MLFTFPSRYWCTIGRVVVFRVGGWSPQIPTGLLVPCGTQELPRANSDFAYGSITHYGATFQKLPLSLLVPTSGSYNPVGTNPNGLPSSLLTARLRSPLLTGSRLISSPPGTEMFHFPGFAAGTYVFSASWPVEPAGFPHSDIFGSKVA